MRGDIVLQRLIETGPPLVELVRGVDDVGNDYTSTQDIALKL
jgi:hypothetical protein